MKKKLLLLASAALLLTTNSFADCRRDTVKFFNVPLNNPKVPTSRNINTFDAAGNNLTALIQSYSGGTWTNSQLFTATYNVNNDELVTIEQRFNTTLGTWENYAKSEYIYSGTNLVDAIASNWNLATNVWDEQTRTTKTYTAQGKVASSIYKQLTVNIDKREFTYDASQNEIKNEYFSWSSNSWVQSTKKETTYTAANKPSLVTNSVYNTGSSSYGNQSQDAYTYDGNNNETQVENRNWNGTAFDGYRRLGTTWSSGKITYTSVSFKTGPSTWETPERTAYQYDANGNLLSTTKQTLQASTPGNPPTLQFDSRIVYEYNTANLQTRKSNQTYNKTTSQFSITTEEGRGYTASGKLARIINVNNISGMGLVPVNETIYEFNTADDLVAIERRSNFDPNQAVYNVVTREEYVCGIATNPNGIRAIRESKLALYPNPAVGSFLLETDAVDATVTITDLVGKVVFENPLVGDKMTISIADFNTGLYVVRLQGKNGNVSRKLVVGK